MTTTPRSHAERARDWARLMRLLVPEATQSVTTAQRDIEEQLDRAAAELTAPGGMLFTAGLADIADEAMRERFSGWILSARNLFATVGVTPPSPDAWARAGVDLKRLASAAAADPSLELVPAPHGLGLAIWRDLFARAAGDGVLKSPGFICSREVDEEFALLDRVQDAATPRVTAGDIEWTLRLIPAAASPAVLGHNHGHETHPSLPEMLTLQLLRIMRGDEPVDQHSFTWIAGTLAGSHLPGTLAARHVFDVTEGVVRVSCREPSNQGPHLGARPPIG